MKRVLTASEMRAVDAASASFGLSAAVLMENAGEHLARVALAASGARGRFFVLCGVGNNGGDGFVAARKLAALERRVFVEVVGSTESLEGVAKENFRALQAVGLSVGPVPDGAGEGDVVIDSLFGTGLSRAPEGAFAAAIERINAMGRAGATVVAADLPSGLQSDVGSAFSPCVDADVTVAFGFLKRGLMVHPGAALAGRVEVVDIGIPRAAHAGLGEPGVFAIETSDALSRLPARTADTHKGTYGHLLVVAGSEGHSGAAALTGLAALRSGAGLVTIAARPNVLSEVLRHAPELMGVALPGEGALSLTDLNRLFDALDGKQALVMGPGLARGADTGKLIGTLLEEITVPTLLDADALNAVAEQLDLLKRAKSELLLTPHPKEFSRLAGGTTAEVNADRLGRARSFALEHHLVVVLKGAHTVIARDDGTLFINTTGNAGMATAGSGDVLSGLCGALIAQGLSVDEAALVGVHAHGLAGDVAAKRVGQLGLIASDLISSLGEVWTSWNR